jgi:hypothetical protein
MDPNYQENPNPSIPEAAPKSKFRFKKIKLPRKHAGLLLFALVILVIGGGAFIYRNQAAKPGLNNTLGAQSEKEQDKQNEDIMKKVQELTLVPLNETPEIAEIADTTKLDDQAFFSRAQNGDKVIIYRTAKRVVLYRPSTNMVIETGPLVEPTTVPGEQEINQ